MEFDRQHTKLNRLTVGSLKTLHVFETDNQTKPLTMEEQASDFHSLIIIVKTNFDFDNIE